MGFLVRGIKWEGSEGFLGTWREGEGKERGQMRVCRGPGCSAFSFGLCMGKGAGVGCSVCLAPSVRLGAITVKANVYWKYTVYQVLCVFCLGSLLSSSEQPCKRSPN